MSLHDYRCDVCGYTLRDHHVPTGQRASEHAPLCPQHQYPLGGVRMAWIPQARFSVFSDSGREAGDSFAKFTLIWRDYSQDHSNRDVHTLAPDPSMKPPKHYSNGTPVTLRRGAPVIADHGEQHEAPLHGPDTLAALEV